jgi:hypothetical protein
VYGVQLDDKINHKRQGNALLSQKEGRVHADQMESWKLRRKENQQPGAFA